MTGIVRSLWYLAPGALGVALAIIILRGGISARTPNRNPDRKRKLSRVPAWAWQVAFSSAIMFSVGGGLLALGGYLAWAFR